MIGQKDGAISETSEITGKNDTFLTHAWLISLSKY